MKYIIALIIMTIISCSCDDKPDKLKPAFSSYNISFDKEGGDTLIYALTDDWSFWDFMSIDSATVAMPHCEDVFPNSEPPVTKPGTCSNETLTVQYDILQKYIEPVSIEGDWFEITKITLREVSIVVSPNLTGNSREVRLTPDYSGTSLTISQSSN